MDSLLASALVAARVTLDAMPGVSDAKPLRMKRDLLERAALAVDVTTAHVARVTLLALEIRDAASALHATHCSVLDALREAMD